MGRATQPVDDAGDEFAQFDYLIRGEKSPDADQRRPQTLNEQVQLNHLSTQVFFERNVGGVVALRFIEEGGTGTQ